MANLVTRHASEDIDGIIQTLEQDGCLVIEGLLDDDEVNPLQSHMHSTFEKIPDCNGNVYGHETKRIGTLFSRHETFQKMAVMNPIIEIMDHFLLQSCNDFQVNLTQATSKGPAEAKRALRQDDLIFPFRHPEQEVMLTCLWAIDEFTEDNGAMVLVPGSHRWERSESVAPSYENLPAEQTAKAVMKKGSVLIYLGSIYHCDSANKSNERRCSAMISYSLGWLRQAENSYLAYSKEAVSTMPERLRHLLGYFAHQPNLGSINGIDPIDYFLNNKSENQLIEFIPEMMYKSLRNEHLN